MSYKPTARQVQALELLGGPATHCLLVGGSRSGKTFIAIWTIVFRALASPKSRHAILRFRFNHVKASIVHDTFPKVMDLCFPGVKWELDKTDWFVTLPNGAQIWFGGLDDKDRTEKILGQEYASLYFNEASQIPHGSMSMALTRLAQKVDCITKQETKPLRLKAYFDCNPPSKGHWLYRMFVAKRDETGSGVSDPENYALIYMNPGDNAANLPADYLKRLEALPARMRLRFLEGRFADVTENALWTLEGIEKWRTQDKLPDMLRIVVAVDPSGADDADNAANDAIGIVVAGLGMDGNGYVLEDLTCKAGPATWGNIATTAYDRWAADLIVGETNYGGAMVKHVIQTSKRGVPFKMLTASRGKAVRAEPISALAEQGKVRHAGQFNELEDELCAFTTAGYTGDRSPNRADAYVWAFSELFPGIVKERTEKKAVREYHPPSGAEGWMA